MPYVPKWVPAHLAIGYVERVDGCGRAAAMQQIDAWARENSHVWICGGDHDFSWRAKINRARLLAQWPKREPVASSACEAPSITEASPMVEALAAPKDHLAEWIFSQRGQKKGFEKLYDEARGSSAGLGEFTKSALLAAWRCVYVTQKHRPPATGWPLREPYKSLARDESLKESDLSH